MYTYQFCYYVSIIYNKEDQEEYGDDYIDPRNGDKKLWQT